ncbi:GDSL-type esterase/lipase family protein [Naasia lichenicola]|uniref:GDSL family lipase n=1 Tax=Naasia lichenicola TaxID=2565933 RepID=A0A4S4FI57_9MICO|nr:GDSL-type esterase/lipase family protein [Naasia lichenicola]THG30023.1 GDSL family lipase [Naasia lichenicola]
MSTTSRSAIGRALGGAAMRRLGGILRNQQLARRDQFEATGAQANRIVFLGDSISEFGNWDEWFPDAPVLNRGIGGETSGMVLDRLDSAIGTPLGVFLLIGTNDLTAALPEPLIVHTVGRILDGIERRAPGTPVWVQSVMPRSAKFRDELDSINGRLQTLVTERPDHIRYLDLWPALSTADGALRNEFTRDHLHLNGEGYRAWTDVLRPIVDRITSGD